MDKELKSLIENNVDIKYNIDDNNVFIIGSYANTIEKEKILVKCIKKLKEFNTQIILCSHYPVIPEIQTLVDYYIFDDHNEILLFDDIKELGLNSVRYIETNNYIVNSYVSFHHDYAVLTNIKNAINFCRQLNKTKFHYLEYDNIIDTFQYYQTFITDINYHDCVLYEYDKGSVENGYCAAFIFSLKDIVAYQILNDFAPTLKDHFKKQDWRIENHLLNLIKKYTNNIKVTNYIDIDNGINVCYLWNREILDGLIFYVVADDEENLYISFNSIKNNYLIEIKYMNYNKFHNIYNYNLIKIGKYVLNNKIILNFMGNNIFEQNLELEFEKFKQMNNVIFK